MAPTTGSVRDITNDEVAAYKRDGWVKLSGLISRDTAAELLRRAQERMGARGDSHEMRPGVDNIYSTSWHDYHQIAEEDELFGAIGFGKAIGRDAQRLMARDVPVQSYSNLLAVKIPAGSETTSKGIGKTAWHQDFPSVPFDRVGMLTFWIALDEVTPEMGAMRFYSGSQRLGSLGRVRWFDGQELTDVYARQLEDLALSPELHYQPGDATVHHSLVIHGAPQNVSNRPRWPFIISYFPADTKFTGAQVAAEAHQDEGASLQVGKPFDPSRFPIVYP